MRATSIGHAGILIETSYGSILCDPWFEPAFFGSWFVFPRNDQLDADLTARIESADYLFVSHLHADHFDVPWLREHLRRDITVLLPGYPTREQERRLQAIGFDTFIRTQDGVEQQLAGDLRVAIHVETSITDGPGGDSALVVSDGESRLVNQNDCRTTDLDALRSHGPVDLHWLQYSGAIWYPMVYDEPPERMRRLVDAKVESQFARAMRYVESIAATAVVPSAGPPCFLDEELFHLNVINGDEPSIFWDQPSFLARLDESGHRGVLAMPGTAVTVEDGAISIEHPVPDDEMARIWTHKERVLREYQQDWAVWLKTERDRWEVPQTDLVATLSAWWQPLLRMAPTLRRAIGAPCLLVAGDVEILVDFVAGEVRLHAGEPYGFRFEIDRALVETVVTERAVDWSNSLFLSCRFRAWREGDFNEYVYNFFKSLSVERMRRTEAEARRKLDPPTEEEPDITLGDYVVARRCPHRNADLSVFGEIQTVDGCDQVVCTLHGWRFDAETGRCLTSADHPLRIRRRADERTSAATEV
ncbi:MAG: MBL fold metallo-hydrolase [Acidimicrobiia bacterium]|nr:MBL fold metallo-hydrolase [Acidimicrobiia bacterium]